ncbi:NIPSNAP family protein, partial [Rhizobium ruizarguesonis]
MFYEIRTYRLKNGTIPQDLKVVEEEGIEIQKSHLGTLVGYFFAEIGTINEIVHIWAF